MKVHSRSALEELYSQEEKKKNIVFHQTIDKKTSKNTDYEEMPINLKAMQIAGFGLGFRGMQGFVPGTWAAVWETE